ncbi:MAG: hypothetical protein ACFN00_05225 [Flavobacteriaceae bacterium]
MKKFLLLLFLLPMFVFAQEELGARFAYTHTNKSHNFVFGGISYSTKAYYGGGTLYAGTHFGTENSKLKVIPEIGAEMYFIIGGAGISLNTQSIQPRLGFSLFNLIQTHIGYSIPFSRNSNFRGFTFTVAFNLYKYR